MNKNMNEQLADALNKAAEAVSKAGNTHQAQPLHGQGGLFSVQGIERDVISALVTPKGIASVLPLVPTVYQNPVFTAITGIEENGNTRPTEPCADAPTGYMTAASLTAAFGLVRKDTSTIDIYKTMLQKNRGDMTDLVLRGRLIGETGLAPSNMSSSDVFTTLTKTEMFNAAVRAERTLSLDFWQGTGVAPRFKGLDSLIATGHVDMFTNAAVPALDSDVKDFGNEYVGGSTKDIVEYLSAIEFYLRSNAMNMGLDPVEWIVTMRPELWYELSAAWPCKYMTNRCDAGGSNAVVINDNVNVATRDAMRNGLYIDINGNRYPVVLDTGIKETVVTGGGAFTSSIYFIPLTINGSFPVTYREYLDYRAADADVNLLRGNQSFWTDDGLYGWSISDEKGWCFQLHLRTEQRLILRTPQLAGKLQNVKYAPLQHTRTPYPGDPYYVAGGVSMRAKDTIYPL